MKHLIFHVFKWRAENCHSISPVASESVVWQIQTYEKIQIVEGVAVNILYRLMVSRRYWCTSKCGLESANYWSSQMRLKALLVNH